MVKTTGSPITRLGGQWSRLPVLLPHGQVVIWGQNKLIQSCLSLTTLFVASDRLQGVLETYSTLGLGIEPWCYCVLYPFYLCMCFTIKQSFVNEAITYKRQDWNVKLIDKTALEKCFIYDIFLLKIWLGSMTWMIHPWSLVPYSGEKLKRFAAKMLFYYTPAGDKSNYFSVMEGCHASFTYRLTGGDSWLHTHWLRWVVLN